MNQFKVENGSKLTIRIITHQAGAAMRADVLRPGGQAPSPGSERLEDPDALHLAAYDDDLLAAVMSFTPHDEEGVKRTDCYQLRGAATAAPYRGKGIGTALVLAGIEKLVERQARRVWCNGRSAARTFYERLGFHIISEEFVTDSGPHFRFERHLP